MGPAITLEADGLPATTALGVRLGRLLFPGAVVGLIGPLGAGKTHLARAIAEGLDVTDPRLVTSPTFVLIQEYPARLPIHHFDAYRLAGPAQFQELGCDEYFQAGGVCLIEWADRVAECFPTEHLRITIHVTGPCSRRFDIAGVGPVHEAVVAALAN